MDRIIEVKINGNYITKDNKNAGVQYEANATMLRVEFDEGWDSYAKKITWWNAKGNNPTARTLTTDLLENAATNTRIYLAPIPGEAMTEAGECTFIIDGYIEGKRQRSVSDKLVVKEAPFEDNAGEPADPTPTQAEQLQGEIDAIMADIQKAVQAAKSAEEAAQSAQEAKDSATAAGISEANAKASETAAAASATGAATSAQTATTGASTATTKAGEAASSASIATTKASEAASSASAAAASASAAASSESAVAASASAAASSASVAATSATNAEASKTAAKEAQAAAENAVGKTSYIGDNGNWFEWDASTGAFVDTGVAAHPFPYVQPEEPPADAPEFSLWVDTGAEALYIARAEGVGF